MRRPQNDKFSTWSTEWVHQISLFYSSSSFELFVVSFMQEDVYVGYTALALTLGEQVFS